MLKHRLSKISKAALLMLLVIGGAFQSCEDVLDEYSYDDGKMPSWLGESVYAFLRDNNTGHTYDYYADIVDKLGETETFKKTGSKTVFVADDAAFERFFNSNNRWGVKKFEDFSESQLKLILKASMLNDAMLLDMLSAKSSKSEDEGTCLRRTTSLVAVDTIPLVMAEDMPQYNKYWDALRGTQRDEQLFIAKDGTAPMMVHILTDYLKNKGVTEDDISFLFDKQGKNYKFGEAYIYDRKIVDSDVELTEFSDDTLTIVCQNGYLYRLDDLLIPPSNMAEELRARAKYDPEWNPEPDTRVFSRLIDRYCLPVYDAQLSRTYNSVTGKEDSIFSLKYYNKSGVNGIAANDAILKAKDQPSSDDVLLFDPGANQYKFGTFDVQSDMAAMLVPDDNAMMEYFKDGEGALILEEYVYSKNSSFGELNSVDKLLEAVDYVPDNLVAKLVNNLMQQSFVGSVPSKFDMITNDANDAMGITKADVKECVVANNGVIYILNKVFGPTAYSAVSAPTIILQNMLVMRHVIQQLGYNSYLLAKDAEYTLFTPDDEYFVYYDPVSRYSMSVTGEKQATVYELHYDANHNKKNDKPYLYAKTYKYDVETYEIDPATLDYTPEADVIDMSAGKKDFGQNSNAKSKFPYFLYNRMTDLLDYLIVVDSVKPSKKYYLSKGGGSVRVTNANTNNPIIQGGEQIERGREITMKFKNSQENGVAFCTVPVEGVLLSDKNLYSGVPTPSTKSLKEQLDANKSYFNEFYKLLTGESGAEVQKVLETLYKENTAGEGKFSSADSVQLYSIFYTNKGDNSVIDGVPFLLPHHYTVYLPSDASIKSLIDKGLPTWSKINAEAAKNPERARSQMRLLNKFIRYHFQDNSLFVDGDLEFTDEQGLPLTSQEFSTQALDKSVYLKLEVTSDNNTIAVIDEMGNTSYVQNEYENENKAWNIMSRDFEFDVVKEGGKSVPTAIRTSSFAVSHLVDNALCFKSLFGYDGKVQKFATGGEPIDTLTIAEGEGSYNGKYLLAKTAKVFTSAIDGRDYMTAGYLVATTEAYVKDGNDLILITADGFRVVEDANGNLDFERDDEGNLLRYSNAGKVIATVAVASGTSTSK